MTNSLLFLIAIKKKTKIVDDLANKLKDVNDRLALPVYIPL